MTTLPATVPPTAPDSGAVVDWSLGGLLAVVMPKTRSASYPAALALAQAADHYVEQTIGKAVYHLAGFGRSEGQAARALELLRLVRGIKGFQLFLRGALYADAWRAMKVLECYLQACATADHRAHCVVMLTERELYGAPSSSISINVTVHPEPQRGLPPPGLEWVEEIDRIAFPCRMLKSHGFYLQRLHPSSAADQIQSGAARLGCGWCPNLRP